jgi:hypothetical protein
MKDLAGQLRAICMALPEVTERPSHGVRLDVAADWKEIAELCQDAYHTITGG